MIKGPRSNNSPSATKYLFGGGSGRTLPRSGHFSSNLDRAEIRDGSITRYLDWLDLATFSWRGPSFKLPRVASRIYDLTILVRSMIDRIVCGEIAAISAAGNVDVRTMSACRGSINQIQHFRAAAGDLFLVGGSG